MGPFVTPARIGASCGGASALVPAPLRLLAGVAQAQFVCVGAKPGVKQKAKGGLTLPSSSLQVIIADDYSDPFDAKNDLKSKAGKGESAGYMEPYEAQRIMTGKQSSWHRDLQLSREVESPFLDTRGRSPASLSTGRFVLSR